MNKSYKIIFNSHTGVWVVVSELVSAHGKRCSSVVAAAATVIAIALSSSAYADFATGGCTTSGSSLNEIGIGANSGTCVVESGGSGAIGIGANVRAVSVAGEAIAIGTGAQAEAANGDMLAIGAGSKATGLDSTAIGGQTTASGRDSVAIGGNGSEATSEGAVTLGFYSSATGVRATALGYFTKATGDDSIAIGGSSSSSTNGANATASHAIAIGAESVAADIGAISIGQGAVANSVANSGDMLAIGVGAQATGTDSTAIGGQTTATGQDSIVIGGNGSSATNTGATVLGYNSSASGSRGTALGSLATASGDNSVAISPGASSVGANSVAIGTSAGATAAGSGGVALGSNANVSGASGVALGSGSSVSTSGGVALGQGSVANVAAGALGYAPSRATTADKAAITATNSTNLGAVSVGTGAAGGNRQIVNVAAGTNDSDAVNVSQLKSLANSTINFTPDNGTTLTRALGDTLKITSGNATGTATTNLLTKTNAAGDGIEISFKETPTFKGADMSGQKITSVGAGSTTAGSTDAVNGGQLNTAVGSVASKLGGGTTFNPATGQVEGGFTAGGNTYATVGDAISGVADTPLTFAGNSGNTARKLGETLTISGGATGATSNSNIKTVVTGSTVDIQLADAPVFTGQVKANGFDASGQKIVNVGAGSTTAGSTDAVNGGQLNTAVGSVASKLGGGTTFNPATGQVEGGFTAGGNTYATVGDAISGVANTPMSFIGDSGTKVDRKLGETLKITSGTATGTATTNLLTKTNAAGDGIEISFKETPTFKGADMSGQKITSVGAGSLVSDSTDAVNGGQLNTAVGSVASKLGGGTTFNPATGQVEGGFTVGGTTYANVSDAIAGTTSGIANTPMSFIGDSGTKVDRKLGETLKITSGTATGTATTNLLTKTNAAGDGIEISFKETPTFKGADMSGQKITSVGAGSLVSDSTDAVNGGQLNTAVGSVASKLGGGTTFNPATGQVEGGFTAGGNTYATVGDAISGVADTPLTFAGNSGNTARKLGETLTISGGATGATSNSNIKTVVTGSTVDIQLADAPVFTGQVKANGFDASGQKIVNVGAGSTAPGSTDAVNGGQLNTAVGSVASKLGGGTTFNPATGKLEGGFDAGGKTYGTVADAISDVGAIANKGWNVSTNGGAATNVAPGATVDISAGSTNLLVSNTGTNIKIDLAQDISLNSVKTGNTTMDSTGVAIGSNVKLGATGLVIAGGPSVTTSGVDAGNKVVTNVAAGAVTEDSKDAVNGSQLFAVKQTAGRGWDMTTNAVGSGVAIGSSVANIAPGDTATFTAGNNIIVTQLGKEVQVAVNPELKGLTSVAINGGPTLSSTGIAMGAGNTLNMGGNAITNVAAGTAGSDAVNLNQMTSAIAAAKTKYYSVNSAGGGNLNNDGATGADAIASGKDAIASKDNSVAIGKGATADTFNSVAIGAASKTADVVATSKTTLGGKDYQYAGTTPVGTVSVGSADNERTITNVAAGRVSATSTDAVNGSQLHVLQTVLSPLLDAGGGGQVGLLPPSAGGVDSANPGRLMTQTYGFNNTTTSSVKASDCQTVNGVDSTGVGLCVKANQKGTTALGSNAQATAENATALGFRSTANGQEAVAIGYQNTAAKQSVAIGTNNTVTGEKSIAIGVGNTVASNRSIVIGDPTESPIDSDGVLSIGNFNTIAGAQQSIAIGSNSTIGAVQTVALGQGAKATTANSVALGASSVTGNYARTQSVSIGGRTFAFAGSGAGLSTVSVGRDGSERQIQNVAAGRISNTSTDAINGSQLYATNQAVETLQAGIGSVYETLNYLDGRITNVARDANAGSASAMAMASMPQAWEPNKTITSMGAASYQGESAYSMGVSRMSDNGRVVLNFGATGNTRNKFGVGVGVGIQW